MPASPPRLSQDASSQGRSRENIERCLAKDRLTEDQGEAETPPLISRLIVFFSPPSFRIAAGVRAPTF
eukprot:m.876053 g.876053  ORF g.876053 m.876053 type:complete len:68 (-) comp59814_c0_seq2:77-280(-)